MKITILDDYFDTLRSLDCFGKPAGHEGTDRNDHVEGTDLLAEQLRESKALVLILGPLAIPCHERFHRRS